ncbi:MAG TPA: NAD(P)/FAD-dependent oxidoreductase [Pirellulales bacterium]
MLLSRRRALVLAAGVGCWAGAGALSPRRALAESVAKADAPRRVLVLGAGMSGLSAALALHRRGHEVTVLEHQDRVGGRLLSVKFANGQTTEAGGGHFRPNMPLATGYISKFRLPIVAMNDGCPHFFLDGKHGDGVRLAERPWALHEAERNVELSSMLTRYLVPQGTDFTTVLDPAWPDPRTADKFDGMSVSEMLTQGGASPDFAKLVAAQGGGFMLDVSVLGLLPDLAYHFGDRNLFRIAGGNEQLPQALAKELAGKIHLGRRVVAIDQSGPEVRVTTEGASAGDATALNRDEWQADAVVSTIPFTVLRDVKISPDLPEKMQQVVAELQWSPVVKVYLQTKSPVWMKQGVRGWPMAASDRPWERIIDITGNEPGGRGNLFFYLTGENAQSYLRQPKATRARDLVALFNADVPGLLDEVTEIGEFSWGDQPWIKAAFGDVPKEGGWMLQEMKKPAGRLHFAGDFTTFKSGWVEGAIESGLRAARQIDPLAPAECDLA